MKASEFMNNDPTVAFPNFTVERTITVMRERKHSSLPVVENGRIVGMVSYRELVMQPLDKEIEEIMIKRVIAVPPDMEVDAVARLMFRRGLRRVPVIDEEGNFFGLITNTDVIRAHIERVTPRKVEKLKQTLEKLHDVSIELREREVDIDPLIPTQQKVYLDELRARKYEIERGLAEPLLVIENRNRFILVDGHHRAMAAKELDIHTMKAYVLKPIHEIELGLEKTAEKLGLKSFKDVQVLDGMSPYKLPLVLENGVVKRMI